MPHNNKAATMDQAFAHVRVLDFTRVLAGPFASFQLAVQGAEVIKVEHHGAYPALGVRGPAPEGTEAALHQLADDLLHRQSISALFDYTASSGLHWRQHALAILGT